MRPNIVCVPGVFLDMSLLWQVIPSSCQLSDRSCHCPKYTEVKGKFLVGGSGLKSFFNPSSWDPESLFLVPNIMLIVFHLNNEGILLAW